MPSPSPTIISAVKLKRRPPLTTLATRLIVTSRSMYGVLSWAAPPRPPSRRSRRSPLLPLRSPPGPPPSRRVRPGIRRSLPSSSSSELQPALAGRVGQRRDAAVVVVAAPVEDNRGDAGLAGPARDQLADLGRARLLVALQRTHVRLQGGRRGQRVAGQVVDDLHDDVPRAALDRQPRPLGAALHLLAQPRVAPLHGQPPVARHPGPH